VSAPFATRPSGTNTVGGLSVVFAFVFAPVGALVGRLGLSQSAAAANRAANAP
jgi:hypothetical protein